MAHVSTRDPQSRDGHLGHLVDLLRGLGLVRAMKEWIQVIAAIAGILNVVVGLFVVAVYLGFWGGRTDERSHRHSTLRLTDPEPEDSKMNGHPTFGEVVRRLEKLEREIPDFYIRKELAFQMHDESRRERNELRALITATQRRLDDSLTP
jgi:hypothetical protein